VILTAHVGRYPDNEIVAFNEFLLASFCLSG
jgi:hypothetical protein